MRATAALTRSHGACLDFWRRIKPPACAGTENPDHAVLRQPPRPGWGLQASRGDVYGEYGWEVTPIRIQDWFKTLLCPKAKINFRALPTPSSELTLNTGQCMNPRTKYGWQKTWNIINPRVMGLLVALPVWTQKYKKKAGKKNCIMTRFIISET